MRCWLRTLFPTLKDEPIEKGLSKWVPCISDIESFLLALLLEFTLFFRSHGIKTMGELFFSCSFYSWKPSEWHQKFWSTLLSRYSCKSLQNYISEGRLLTEKEFTAYIKELRDDESLTCNVNLYGWLALHYAEQILQYGSETYPTASRYYQKWKNRRGLLFDNKEKSLFLFDGNDEYLF